MLETISIILVVVWALDIFTFYISSRLIHALLIVSMAFLMVRLIRCRKIYSWKNNPGEKNCQGF